VAGRKRKQTAELTLLASDDKIEVKPTNGDPQQLTEEERKRLSKPVDEVLLGFDRRLEDLEVSYRNLAKLTKMVYEVSVSTMSAANETRDSVKEIKSMCYAIHGVKPPEKNGKRK